MIFKGNLVTLRPLEVEDAPITLKWRLSDRARMLQRGSQTIGQQLDWIYASNTNGDLNFIAEYAGRPVGMQSICSISGIHKTASTGRMLVGEEVDGLPVMLEADLILCDYAFGELGLDTIYGDVMVDNKSMIQARLYLGYHQDGVLRSHYLYDGVRKDTVALSILKDEWPMCRSKQVEILSLMSGIDEAEWATPIFAS